MPEDLDQRSRDQRSATIPLIQAPRRGGAPRVFAVSNHADATSERLLRRTEMAAAPRRNGWTLRAAPSTSFDHFCARCYLYATCGSGCPAQWESPRAVGRGTDSSQWPACPALQEFMSVFRFLVVAICFLSVDSLTASTAGSPACHTNSGLPSWRQVDEVNSSHRPGLGDVGAG